MLNSEQVPYWHLGGCGCSKMRRYSSIRCGYFGLLTFLVGLALLTDVAQAAVHAERTRGGWLDRCVAGGEDAGGFARVAHLPGARPGGRLVSV